MPGRVPGAGCQAGAVQHSQVVGGRLLGQSDLLRHRPHLLGLRTDDAQDGATIPVGECPQCEVDGRGFGGHEGHHTQTDFCTQEDLWNVFVTTPSKDAGDFIPWHGLCLRWRWFLASHDEIYDGLTPGVLPPRKEWKATPVKLLRSPEYKGPFPVAFTPPRDVTPGLIGMVIDGMVDPHDLTATIVDLSARGFLRIKVLDDGKGKRRGKDWLLQPCSKPRSNLMRYEKTFLEGAFPDGREKRMSELVRKHKKVFRQLTSDIYEETSRRGWYRQNPNPGGRRHKLGRVAAGMVAGVAALVIAGGGVVGILAAAMFVATGVVAAFGPRRRVPRTGAGTATRIQALGFKQYLATAEAEQIRFEEAENIFSRYLPYAMVFGVADHWVKIFRELAIERNVEWDIDWIDVGADVAGELVFQMLTLDLLDGADGLFDGIGGLFEGFDLGDFLDGIDFDFDF